MHAERCMDTSLHHCSMVEATSLYQYLFCIRRGQTSTKNIIQYLVLSISVEQVGRAADSAGLIIDLAPLLEELATLNQALLAAQDTLETAFDDQRRSRVNAALRQLERAWGEAEGLPGRPWFRNIFATSNRDSGYGAVVLPLFNEAIVDHDQAALNRALKRYRIAFRRLSAAAMKISDVGVDPSGGS